jgi:hypothetical protein
MIMVTAKIGGVTTILDKKIDAANKMHEYGGKWKESASKQKHSWS